MKRLHIVVMLAITFICPGMAMADSHAKGPEKVGEGVVDTVTSPAEVVKGIDEEIEDKGAAGVVTGPVKGGANAAGQAVKGAAGVATGVVETILDPLTGGDN